MSCIALRNVRYRYPLDDVDIIRDVSFDIDEGEVCALIGANGSGKTTICNIVRGFIPQFYRGDLSGMVTVQGKPVSSYDEASLTKVVGYSFQNPFTQMSGVKTNVREEIGYALENLGVEREQIAERVSQMIDMFKLKDFEDKNPMALSGGQRQRVAIASVLVTDPSVVILDEPTSQLDPQGTEDIFAIVDMLKSRGKTVILVEHKIDLVAEHCDKVLLMDHGAVALKGTVHDVLTDPRVLEYGGSLPQVARYVLERNRMLGRHDAVPITIAEALELMRGSN